MIKSENERIFESSSVETLTIPCVITINRLGKNDTIETVKGETKNYDVKGRKFQYVIDYQSFNFFLHKEIEGERLFITHWESKKKALDFCMGSDALEKESLIAALNMLNLMIRDAGINRVCAALKKATGETE